MQKNTAASNAVISQINVGLALLIGGLFFVTKALPVFAHHLPIPTLEECQANGNKKIVICHATSSDEVNPYVMIDISCEALYGDNGNAGHFDENGSPLNGHEDDYIPHDGETCNPEASASPSPTPSVEPSPTAEPSATPNPSPTLEPSATPEPSPSMEPSASPEASPSASPTASSNPAPSNPPESGKGGGSSESGRQTSLGNDNLQCTQKTFDAAMDVKDNGTGVKDVLVTFVYNGSTKQAHTNENGRAKVTFDQNGNGTITASAEGWNTQSMSLTMPMCGDVHLDPDRSRGSVLGASTGINGRGVGQVLGASTLANTGSQVEYLLLSVFGTGLITTASALYGYFQTKQN
ncbi:MAG TPA: hypothetical protein VD999_03425 [Vitreimonas sp.]|nr:hypothetical protein [Vitreimonas sp.]